MPNFCHLPRQASGTAGLLRRMLQYGILSGATLLLTVSLVAPLRADTCPDLQPFYERAAAASVNWLQLATQLGGLQLRCLHNAQYFALYGAAQLNAGLTAAALETLERALLMDADSGAAQVDYAEALFRHGQVFPALDMNARVLERSDVPAPLRLELQERQQAWRRLTRPRVVQGDLLFGHNTNLNRGPDTSRLTLTLSGEPVEFELSPEFQPVSGLFTNLRLTGLQAWHEPGYSHNLLLEIRRRVSEDSASDLTQLEGRYFFALHQRRRSWLYGGAVSTLQMGGQALFTGSEASLRLISGSEGRCASYVSAAGQHQYYHRQGGDLDAIELRLAGGLDCGVVRPGSPSVGGVAEQRLLLELGMLANHALSNARPGGDRLGWQARIDWQRPLFAGAVGLQLAHTRLHDERGYSELLSAGARRDLRRSYAQLQYRQPIWRDADLLLNLYHQRQRSRIALFRSLDSSVELGFSWRF